MGLYPITFTLSSLAGLLWLGFDPGGLRSSDGEVDPRAAIDAGLTGLVVGLLTARAAYVLTHWSHFATHRADTMRFWLGGLDWPAGVAGGLLGAGFYALVARKRFWPLLDALAIPAAVLAFGSWLGCLLDGCAYGGAADLGALTPRAADTFGAMTNRWPVQGFGAVYSLALVPALYWLGSNLRKKGQLAAAALALIGGGNLALDFLRADPVPTIGCLRWTGVAAAGLCLAAGMVFLLRHRSRPL
jgi:phosphatidylglycerol:prolipoprotein diacylglycerol transferase